MRARSMSGIMKISHMSKKNSPGQQSKAASGKIRIANERFDKEFRMVIGNQGDLRIQPGALIEDFEGEIHGQGNTLNIGPNARVEGLRVYIDGDYNQIDLRDGSSFKNCSITICGEKEYGNFRGHRNDLRLGESGDFTENHIEVKGSGNRLRIGAQGLHPETHGDLFSRLWLLDPDR